MSFTNEGYELALDVFDTWDNDESKNRPSYRYWILNKVKPVDPTFTDFVEWLKGDFVERTDEEEFAFIKNLFTKYEPNPTQGLGEAIELANRYGSQFLVNEINKLKKRLEDS